MVRKQQRLAIWMNGIRVGFWEKSKGDDSLRYLPEWVADEQGRPLSLSLLFTPGNQIWHGNVVRDYFDNLLPDSEGIRRRLAMRYQASRTFRPVEGAGKRLSGGNTVFFLRHNIRTT